VLVGAHQPPVGYVGTPFALGLKIGGEGALGGMLCVFLWYPPSALGFGTALVRLMDEIVLAIPSITFVLVVPSLGLLWVGSGGFFGGAFLFAKVWWFGGIFGRGGVGDCGCCFVC